MPGNPAGNLHRDCVTNAAIAGTMPNPLDTDDPEQQEANRAYAQAWAGRLMGCQRVALL